MKDPFSQIKRNHRRWQIQYVCRTFAGPSTFRMLKKWKHDDIRCLVYQVLHDCREIRSANSAQQFSARLKKAIASLQRKSRNYAGRRHRQISFGHAAKLVNLYVKSLVERRGLLSESQAERLARHAHVPLDRIVLGRMLKDFGGEAVKCGLKKTTAIKSLKETQYDQLQALLRRAANRAGLNPIEYDLWWAVAKR